MLTNTCNDRNMYLSIPEKEKRTKYLFELARDNVIHIVMPG